MNPRTYDVEGIKITITDADKNAEEAAIQLASSMKTATKIREIATNPVALDCIEKYSVNGEKLVQANALLKETMKAQVSVITFLQNKDYNNFTKSSVEAAKKFKELKSLLGSIEFPEIDNNLKKLLTDPMLKGAASLNSQKAVTLKNFNYCVEADANITKLAKAYIARRRELGTLPPKAPVQPAPVANANPPSFMHSNKSSAEAAKAAAAKPGVQPLPPNNNQKQK